MCWAEWLRVRWGQPGCVLGWGEVLGALQGAPCYWKGQASTGRERVGLGLMQK